MGSSADVVIDRLKAFLVNLSSEQRARFYCLLLFELTIAGRDISTGDNRDEMLREFKCLNELSHQVSQHLYSCLRGGSKLSSAYSDAALHNVLLEKAAAGRCLPSLLASIVGAQHRYNLDLSQ
jgi:hypothetical protein